VIRVEYMEPSYVSTCLVFSWSFVILHTTCVLVVPRLQFGEELVNFLSFFQSLLTVRVCVCVKVY
jgi:hypothetical protein